MFKINTEKDLVNFLRILSEESVKKSRQILKEQDPYTEYYSNKRQTEKDLFEQPEAAQAAGEQSDQSDSTAGAPEAKDTSSSPEEQSQENNPESESSEESFTGSKDRLVDFVNDIRSAPSIKDSMVSDQIDAYYDRLSQEEKDVLVFFLRELSRVMTGKASGTEARDPSDPPLNIDFVVKTDSDTSGEAPESEEPTEETPESGSEPSSTPTPPTGGPSGEEEDTSAPIRVDEAQDHTYLRMKIREILK